MKSLFRQLPEANRSQDLGRFCLLREPGSASSHFASFRSNFQIQNDPPVSCLPSATSLCTLHSPSHAPIPLAMLPASLFIVIQSFLLLADALQELSLGAIADLNSTQLPTPPTFNLPSRSNTTFVSIALCEQSDDPPRFFVTNDTSISDPGSSDVDNVNVFEISIGSEGFGSWSGNLTNGGILSVQNGSAVTSFEVLVSTSSEFIPSVIHVRITEFYRRDERNFLPSLRRYDRQPGAHLLPSL